MTEWVRGVKAGLISIPIYGAALWILVQTAARIHSFDLSEQMTGFGTETVPLVSLEGFLFTVFGFGITFGIIYGLIFAAVYEKFPGKSSLIKGATLGVALWIIFGLITQATGGVVTILGDPLVLFPTFLVGGLTAAILFGALLGFLWDKFAIKR